MEQFLNGCLQFGLPALMGAIASWIQGRPFESWDISEGLKDALNLGIALFASFAGGFAVVMIQTILSGTEITWLYIFANSWGVLMASQIVFKSYFKRQ